MIDTLAKVQEAIAEDMVKGTCDDWMDMVILVALDKEAAGK